MEYQEFLVKGEVDLIKFTSNYKEFSNKIQKIIPSDKNYKIQETIENVYKKGKIERVCMKIKIIIGDEKNNHKKEFIEIKSNLEKILGHKVEEVKI
jgi:hypothetical protein